MVVWDKYNKKTRVNFIESKYLHTYSLTHLKDYIKRRHKKQVNRSFKELPFYWALIEKPYTNIQASIL